MGVLGADVMFYTFMFLRDLDGDGGLVSTFYHNILQNAVSSIFL